MTTWIKFEDSLPPVMKDVLISDGKCISAACISMYGKEGKYHMHGAGFGGYEWEWDFTPTHWAELPEPPNESR